jgi:hypothetical protein
MTEFTFHTEDSAPEASKPFLAIKTEGEYIRVQEYAQCEHRR